MDDSFAGSVEMSGINDQICMYSGALNMEAGEYEVTLKFRRPENLEIMKIVLS